VGAMDYTWALAGALAGIPIGIGLRGTVFRHAVPSGEPLRTVCPGCGRQQGRAPLGVRCAQCRYRLRTPLVLELATAAVLAAVLGRFAGQWEAAAFAFLGVLGVALATIDVAVQRLPDRLTLPAYPVLAALLGVAAIADGDLAALGRALLGGVALAASYYVLALLRPGQLGGGDIKLAGLLGLALGWLGWPVLVMGGMLGFLLFSVVALSLLVARRITLRSHLAFGPFMLAGAFVALIAI
jgi:leader peptidase (prepilin peptidase)/N-methyltransferase